MKCSRPNCSNTARRRRTGYCEKHYYASEHGYADSARAIAHYRALRAAGMSVRHIAEQTGLNDYTLIRLGRWSSRARVELETERRITSIPIPTTIVAAGSTSIPAVGTHRRLRALMAIGYRLSDIGEQLGVTPQAIGGHFEYDTVSAATAANIAALFNRIHLTPGPSERTRAHARKKGWPVPLAWDEDTIDDPAGKPHDVARVGPRRTSPLTAAELADEVDQHRRMGRTLPQIAERMNIEAEAISRRLDRHEKFVAAVTAYRAEGRTDAEIAELMGIDPRMFHRSLANHGLDPCHDVAV